MQNRDRLANRRQCENLEFSCQGIRYTASIGRFDDGRVAEVFINNSKVGSSSEANARDAAIVLSIALQHGVALEVIRQSLSRDSNGRASSPIGTVLDIITGDQDGPNG
jgi:ribonucleoside-diphosphate reductase alpha chain